jgi:Glycosyl hydrolase family 76
VADAGDPTLVEPALAAWKALRVGAWRRGLLRTTVTNGPPGGKAAVWPLGQVIAGALDIALMLDTQPAAPLTTDRRTDAAARIRADLNFLLGVLETYRHGDGYGPYPGDRTHYFDDNAWIGLDLMQAYAQLGHTELLDRAGAVFRSIRPGERNAVERNGGAGGIRWVDQPDSPYTTASTAPSAQLAMRLGARHQDPSLLAFALRQSAFVHSVLRRDDGLLADNIDRSGRVEDIVWSYNQGTPVGLDVLLHRVTGDDLYLSRARDTADAALAHFGGGAGDALWRQAPVFNGILFRNLLALGATTQAPRYREAAAAYANRARTQALDPTGWYLGGGIGRYEPGGTIDQAGLVQILALLAIPDAALEEVS